MGQVVGRGFGQSCTELRGDAGVVDVDDRQVAPDEPVLESGRDDRGDRHGVIHHELDTGLGGCAGGSIGR